MAAEKTGTRRAFSAEFKVEALRRLAERRAAGVPATQVGREMGVTDHLLRKWQRQAADRAGAAPADVFPGQGRLPADEAELKRLERENARLEQEVAFLKTAAAYMPVALRCRAAGIARESR